MEPRGPVTVSSVVLGAAGEPGLVRAAHWAPPWWRFGHNDAYALRTSGGVVLVDPELVGDGDAPFWSALGAAVCAIVLTTDSHERGAYALRDRYGAPVWGPRGGDFDGAPDRLYDDSEALPGGLTARRVLGAAHAFAWRAPSGEHVLFTGDVLNGGSDPRHPAFAELDRREVGLYAGASADHVRRVGPEALRRGLGPLLDAPVDVICGGHSVPVARAAHRALERLLALEWEATLRQGRDVGVPLADD